MSDAAFVEEVLRSLEALDTACLEFLAADKTIPRDLQLVTRLFRRVNDCKDALLHHDLLRLDALAGQVLASSPGDWSIRFREDVVGQTTDVEALVRRIRRRHNPLIHLAGLLDGADESNRRDRGTVADNQPRHRGRKPRFDRQEDQKISEAWQRAREAGVSKKDFAKDNQTSLKNLNRLLNRVRRRKNGTDK
jgi:hypothetical protein